MAQAQHHRCNFPCYFVWVWKYKLAFTQININLPCPPRAIYCIRNHTAVMWDRFACCFRCIDAFFFLSAAESFLLGLPPEYASGPNSLAMNFLKEALYHLFLMWFSDLLLVKYFVDISTQRFPSFLWPSHNNKSSSRENGKWLIAGFKWFTQRSRICLPTRPGNLWAKSDQRVKGCSVEVVTTSMTMASSWSVHCPLRTPGLR